MSIDIAAMNATQKLAFAQAVGSILLSSDTISAPVTSFDIALPSGYFRYRLALTGFVFSPTDFLAGAISSDGGSSFLCDAVNFDCYRYNEIIKDGVTAPGTGSYNTDSLLDLGPTSNGALGVGIGADLIINPGSADEYFSFMGMFISSALSGFAQCHTVCAVNSEATVPVTQTRANVLRLLPYGNGDIPPTGGGTITAGSWALYGNAI